MQASISNNRQINCSISNNRNINCSMGASNNIQADTCAPNDINAGSTQRGPQGIPGEAATIAVGTVTTGAAGTDASVTNSGTSADAVFNFTIPRGAPGQDGTNGVSPIATVTKSGDTATISITDVNGTTTATVTDGADGQDGAAATISVGTVQTGAAGTSASVTNSGTSSAAVFDFTIPKGDTGATGADGYSPTATVTKSGDTATITITDKNGTTTATVTDGSSGASSMSQLTDVDLTGLSNGDTLIYNSTSQEWEAGEIVDGVTDVEVNGTSVLSGTVAEIDLTGYQEKLTAGTDLEIVQGSTLPSGYTELTSITSTGTQWINTGKKLTNNFKSIIVGRLVGTQVNNFRTILGAYNSNLSSSKQNVLLGWGSSTNGFYTEPCIAPTSYVYSSYPWDTNTHTFTTTVTPTVTTLDIDGTINTVNSAPSITGVNLAIFARLGQNNTVNSEVKFELNSIELYQSGSLVFKGIPAQRNADGEVGLYDTVSSSFFPNSGTGDFTAGSIVPAITVINFTNESGYALQTDVDDALALKQDSLTAGTDLEIVNTRLPNGYTELEYIQSDGACYIDSGTVSNGTDTIEQSFQKLGTSTTTCSWFGSLESPSLIRVSIGSYRRSVQQDDKLFIGYNLTVPVGPLDTNRHTIKMYYNGGAYYCGLDGAAETYTPTSTDQPTINSWLFARHGGLGQSTTYDNEGTKIFYHKQWRNNGTMILDLVPARREADGKLGFYDLVSNTFKTNGGTGTLTAGPDVTYNGATINFTNDSGYITGIDSSDVTTALGYTPAENDLSNLTTTSTKNFDGQWVTTNETIAQSVAVSGVTSDTTYNISSLLPSDTYDYECLIWCYAETTAAAAKYMLVSLYSDIMTTYTAVCGGRASAAYAEYGYGNIILPVGTGRTVTVAGSTSANQVGTYTIKLTGYCRIGTNT